MAALSSTPLLDGTHDGQPVQPIGKRFVTAGNAIFTIVGREHRFTYRVTASTDPDRPRVWFVSLLTGPDNNNDYTYIGLLDVATGQVRLTRKSRLTDQSPAIVAIRWTFARLWTNRPIAPAAIFHEGRCGRCGRRLTVPESIESGIGPECARHV